MPNLIAFVTWDDHYSLHEWLAPDDPSLTEGSTEMLSVGWLLYEDANRIVLSTTRDPSAELAADPLVILKSAIRSLRKFRPPAGYR